MELSTLNFFLAVIGLALLVVTLILYVDYFFFQRRCFKRLSEYAWPLILLNTIGGTAIALLYSEYYGFVPCSLCWLQRIALFPQALFSVMAFKIKEQTYFPLYGIGLSIFGFIVSVYHYIYQSIPKETATNGMVLPCLADGTGDCAVKVINEFGFVTFPFLTAVMFLFLIIVYLNLRKK